MPDNDLDGNIYSFCIARSTTANRAESVANAMSKSFETICKKRGLDVPAELKILVSHSIEKDPLARQGPVIVVGYGDIYLDAAKDAEHNSFLQRTSYKAVVDEISKATDHAELIKLHSEALELNPDQKQD